MAISVAFTFDPLTVHQLQELAVLRGRNKSELLRELVRQEYARLQAEQPSPTGSDTSNPQQAATTG